MTLPTMILLASKQPDASSLAKAAGETLIPSHDFAVAMLRVVDTLLGWLGISKTGWVEEVLYTALVLGLSFLAGMIIRYLAVIGIRKLVELRHSETSKELLELHTFSKCSHFIPPLMFICLIPFAFTHDHHMLEWILRFSAVYLICTLGIALCAILQYVWVHFDRHDNEKNLPLKGVYNIGRGIVWLVILIVCVSILLDKSPLTLLAGLGAFAAALMLIFKDSILGFVAGIQLSNNDMLRVGDWICVPSTIANGIVIDVTLTVVKVQNFDNTIVMLPPYTLVSTSFQNWRGMSASGYRLFNRSVYIDQQTIRTATPQLLDSVRAKYPEMAEYIDSRLAARQRGEGNQYNPSTQPNGTIDTNLGLFRAYVTTYLLHHPQVGVGLDLLVKLDAANEFGQPLNIYFYSKITAWTAYAALGSEIYEHIAVAAPDFGLRLYNAPDGNRYSFIPASGATPAPAPIAAPTSTPA